MDSRRLSITPERKEAFLEFVASVPRRCSPTVCGLLATSTTSVEKKVETRKLDPLVDVSMMSVSSFSPDKNGGFEWSIDEISTYYGAEFANVDEVDQFHRYESQTQLSRQHENESRVFFAQEIIHPSPEKVRTTPQASNNDQPKPRNTDEFLNYIEHFTKEQQMTMEQSPSEDEAESTMNASPKSLEANNNWAIEMAKPVEDSARNKSEEKYKLSIEADNFCATSKIQIKGFASKYFNFLSPISPISRRAKQTPTSSKDKRSFSNIMNMISPILASNRKPQPLSKADDFEMDADFSEKLTFEHDTTKKSRDDSSSNDTKLFLSPDSSMLSVDQNSNNSCDAGCDCSKHNSSKDSSAKENRFEFKTPTIARRRARRSKLQFDGITSTPN